MKKIIIPVLASLAFATPALANEARVEARGGVVWAGGTTEDIWGLAAGYDWDLGSSGFIGVEAAGDKIGTSGFKVSFSGGGRAGIKSGGTKVYALGAIASEACTSCGTMWHAGAGIQQNIGSSVYVKLEYRHLFVQASTGDDLDAVGAGVGMRF